MIFRLRLLSEFATVVAFTLFEPYYVAAQGIPITLCKPDFISRFPKEMYDVNLLQGPDFMNCVEATNNNLEDINNIIVKVLSDKRCKKVDSFVKQTVKGVMEADIQGFKQLSNFLLDVPDKWFMQGCKMEAGACIEEVVLPAIESYIKNDRDVDGCCVRVLESQEIEKGKLILHELKDIVDGLVCTKRIKSSKEDQAQTCGYTFIQGLIEKRDSYWSSWVRNLMPIVQIPTDQACSAFWGGKFVNTSGKMVKMMSSSPLRNCANGYDALFSWISRTFMDLAASYPQVCVDNDSPDGLYDNGLGNMMSMCTWASMHPSKRCGQMGRRKKEKKPIKEFCRKTCSNCSTESLLDAEPTLKNIIEMFHTILFLDDKCLRVETPLFFLSNYCDNNDSNNSNDSPTVSSGDDFGSFAREVSKVSNGLLKNFLPVVAPRTLQRSSDDDELLSEILSDIMKMCLTMPTGFSPYCVTKCKNKKGMFTSRRKRIICNKLENMEDKNDVCKMPVDGHAGALVENFCPRACNHEICSPK